MTYIPTIYGFKIFGQKGSAYEYKYDNNGNQMNKKEVDKILNNKSSGAAKDDDAPQHSNPVMKSSSKYQAAIVNQF